MILVLLATLALPPARFGADCAEPYVPATEDTAELRLWVYDNMPAACFAEPLVVIEKRQLLQERLRQVRALLRARQLQRRYSLPAK